MKRKERKKTKLDELNDKHFELQKRLSQAYSSGASHTIIHQLQTMLQENELNIYDEQELEHHRAEENGDDDNNFIV